MLFTIVFIVLNKITWAYIEQLSNFHDQFWTYERFTVKGFLVLTQRKSTES